MTKNKNKSYNNYARYSALVFEMIVLIVAAVLGGKWLDEQLEFDTPVFTLILSLVSITGALFLFIKKLTSR